MKLTKQQLEADLKCAVERANQAGCFHCREDRFTGNSSNAIFRLAYGGKAPTQRELPYDRSDLMACFRTVRKLPKHRKTEKVLAALGKAHAEIKRREQAGKK